LGIKRDSDEAANGRRQKKCQISNVLRNHGPLRCAEQTISFTSIVQDATLLLYPPAFM
jgi:hypothetical protein